MKQLIFLLLISCSLLSQAQYITYPILPSTSTSASVKRVYQAKDIDAMFAAVNKKIADIDARVSAIEKGSVNVDSLVRVIYDSINRAKIIVQSNIDANTTFDKSRDRIIIADRAAWTASITSLQSDIVASNKQITALLAKPNPINETDFLLLSAQLEHLKSRYEALINLLKQAE